MTFFELLRQILLDERFTNYISIIQVAVVLFLAIQCYQAYKMGFKEFKFISIAWVVNIFNLLVTITIRKTSLDFEFVLIFRIFSDLLCMYFFLLAVIDSLESKPFDKLKKIPKLYLIVFLMFGGISKVIPGSLRVIPYIHLRYLPAAAIDFLVLLLLANFFKELSKKFGQNRGLYYTTLAFAIIQFLWVLQPDQKDTNFVLRHLDNIGFSLTVVLKTGILVYLSVLLIKIINFSAIKEKKNLLNKLTFATNLLNIKDAQLATLTTTEEKEGAILKLTLYECLNLLEKKIGYYGSYDSQLETINLQLASDNYRHSIGQFLPAHSGIAGKSVITKETQLIKNISNFPDYLAQMPLADGEQPHSVSTEIKSAVAIPVILDSEVLGVYVFESETENYFTDIDVKIFIALVAQALTAIKNIRHVQEIDLSKTLLNSLREIDQVIVDRSWELENILNTILKKSLELVRGEFGYIALKTQNRDELNIVDSTDNRNISAKIKISDSLSGLAVMSQMTIYVPDIENSDEIQKKLHKNYLGNNLVCQLMVPLIVQNEVIGVFNTESNQTNKFTQSDIERVEGFAGQAAIAIHIFQLFEEVKKHRDSLEMLAEIDLLILNSNKNLPDTLEEILKRGMHLIQKKHGEIVLLEKDKNGQDCLVIKKSTNELDEGTSFPLNEQSMCGVALKKKKIVYMPFIDINGQNVLDFNSDDIYFPTDEEKSLYYTPPWGKMKSELVLPLILHGNAIGLLNIESEEYNAFHESEISLLKNLALASAIAINNARQFEEIHLKNIELMNSVDKDKIKLSASLGRVLNHRIGNSIGFIRIKLKDMLDGDYGEFSEKVKQDFKVMIESAEKVIGARVEISEKMEELLTSRSTSIDLLEVKKEIESTEEFYSNPGITINIQGFENLSPILVNFNLFVEGVVLELIRNAIKSMPDGGNIDIVGKAEGKYNVISFSDTGCGIENRNLDIIFNEGYSKWPKGVGSGTGLFELKTILEFFRGIIVVESEVGRGTTFIVKLPRY